MTKDDIIRMAREAGGLNCDCCLPEPEPHEMQEFIERFAALVAAHEREKVAKWTVERGYATGHGDTVEDLLTEIDWQAAEREREECAKVANAWQTDVLNPLYQCDCATAIRRRGEK
jgi:hypothetical protein